MSEKKILNNDIVSVSTGKLGVGTTSPNEKLEVSGEGNVYAKITSTTTSGNAGVKFLSTNAREYGIFTDGNLRFYDFSASAERMRITQAGNVGIGTTSPGAKLHIHHTSEEVLRIDSGTTGAIHFFENTTRRGILGYSNGTSITTAADAGDMVLRAESGSKLHLAIAGTSRLTVSGSNVGIGTTSPAQKLHVKGDIRADFNNTDGSAYLTGYGVEFERGTNYLRPRGTDGTQTLIFGGGDDSLDWNNIQFKTSGYINFRMSGADVVRINSSGNVGIGTSSPNTFLHIAGQGNRSGGQIYLGNQDDGSVKYSLITSAHYNAATEPEGFTLITGLSTATENTVSIGGFVYESNPATDIRFFTHTATTHTTGGSERMRITSSGNVGIGTTSPGSTLEVDGSFNVVNGNNSITHFNYVDGSTNYVRGITYFDNASAYFTGGNVGIGTTSPSHKLHVEGFIATNDSSNASGLLIRKAGSTIGFVGQSGGWVGDTTDDLTLSSETGKNIRFYTNGSITERMRITSDGNVGIGTTSPAEKLNIYTATGRNFKVNQSTANVTILENDYELELRSGGGYDLKLNANGSSTYGNVTFRTDGSERMRITSAGNVGIGTTSPTTKLYVDGGESTFNRGNSAGAIARFRGSNAEKAVIGTVDSWFASNVGIGTTSPDVKLEVVAASPTDGIVADFVNSTNAGGTVAAIKLSNADSEACDVVLGANRVGANFGSDFFISLSDGVDGTNQERLRITESGNVGIGTTSPATKLHISGGTDTAVIRLENVSTGLSAGDTLGAVQFYNNDDTDNSPNIAASIYAVAGPSGGSGHLRFRTKETGVEGAAATDTMTLNNAGNVGIGTTSPGYKLHVDDNTAYGGVLIEGDNAPGLSIRDNSGTSLSKIYVQSTASSQGNLRISSDDNNTATTPTIEFIIGGSHKMRVLDNGNVGIGTTSPGAALEVNAQGTGNGIGGYTSFKTKYGTASVQSLSIGQVTAGNGAWIGTAEYRNAGYWQTEGTAASVISLGAAGEITFATNTGLTANTDYNISERMRIQANGYVGIGTTDAQMPLQVVGAGPALSGTTAYSSRFIQDKTNYRGIFLGYDTVSTTGIVGAESGGPVSNIAFWAYSGSSWGEKMRVTGGGNVGIGTTSPVRTLVVDKSNSGSTGGYIRVQNKIGGAGSNVGIDFATYSPEFYETSSTDPTAQIRVVDYASYTGRLEIRVKGVGASGILSPVATFDYTGNVGIGTTSPAQKLDVAGSVIINDTSDPTLYMRRNDGTPVSAIMLDTSTDNIIIGATNMDELIFRDDSGEAMRIDGSGNVGIGSTAPAAKLNVASTGANAYSSTITKGTNMKGIINVLSNNADDMVGVYFGTGTTSEGTHWSGITGSRSQSGTDWSTQLNFYTHNEDLANITTATQKMVIKGNGNVGIGTTSPAQKLDVDGDIALKGTAVFNFVSPALTIGDIAGTDSVNSLKLTTADDSTTVYLDDGGNVGIGTTSPEGKLDVNGAIIAGADGGTAGTLALTDRYAGDDHLASIGFLRSSGGTYIGYGVKQEGSSDWTSTFDNFSGKRNYLAIDEDSIKIAYAAAQQTTVGDAVTLSEKFRFNLANGRLGIGTTAPATKLHAVGTTGEVIRVSSAETTTGAVDTGAYVSLGGHDGVNPRTFGYLGGFKENGTSGNYSGYLSLATRANGGTSTEKMRITSSGNVGIGTSSPNYKLDVNGDIALKGTSVFNLNSAALTIGDTAGTDSVTTLKLTTAGDSTTVYLDDDGNVGINTATPSYNLTVDSGTNDIGILTASSDSGSYVGFLDNATSTIPKIGAVGNKLILDASQYVGIKRTDPSYALDVSGTIRATGDVIAYSDARVKENVETIPNALDKVKAMRGVGYNKIGEQKRSIGVIAQEMIEVMPEVVSQDEQGMYSVAYGNLVGVLVEAMKEQQKQIDELKAQLDGITK